MKQKLLLLDSIGAFFSALLLIVVGKFESLFGISDEIIKLLVPIPIVFSIYSLVAYYFSKHKWPIFLKVIAVANLLYCLLTLLIIITHFEKLTVLGVSYFAIEIVIIVFLALYEFRVSSIKTTFID